MMRLPALAMTALLATALAGCSVFGGKAAEEPPFDVVRADGEIEIRDYPAIVVARTTVTADDRDAAVSEGFSRLFGYISGDNTVTAEIDMTAPVIVEDGAAQEIAMTAPVIVEGAAVDGAKAWTTEFVLPEGMTAESAPAPTDPTVEIATVPPRRTAVLRFSGFFSDGNVAEAQAALEAWLTAEGVAHAGDWQSAGYNPPWTIPWFRRNEVWVTLAATPTE
ncbi:MAG: heme-binding protein [Pseudomonadota bacterium]